jgi:hypothetical protein
MHPFLVRLVASIQQEDYRNGRINELGLGPLGGHSLRAIQRGQLY